MDNSHFNKIFWFVVFITFVTLLYVIAITFLPIPKENVRFADTTQGFLLGSVLGAGISYLLGGSPAMHSSGKPGTTSADVHISTTQEAKKED